MGTYEVVVAVEPSVVMDYEHFVYETYLPALEATECFTRVEFDRLVRRRYRLRLHPKSEVELERYLRDHAARLRDEFKRHIPHGIVVIRTPGTASEGVGNSASDRLTARLRDALDQ